MATVYQELDPGSGQARTTNFAVLQRPQGTNLPDAVLRFDGAVEQDIFWRFRAVSYGSGNLTVSIDWYADTGITTGDVAWIVQLAAITPDTDTGAVDAKALATANTVTDSHLGTTAKRLHRAVVTVSNLDSLGANDAVWVRLARDADNVAADTISGYVFVNGVTVSYSDT